jgi:chromate transporter
MVLWLVPLATVVSALGAGSLWTRLYLFFPQAALVTFGGADAGLALAETTSGPLVIVLQFPGFMAGWNLPVPFGQPGAAFLPSLAFIPLGAPHVERIAREPRTSAALAAISAVVVSVIATLAVLLGKVVLLPGVLGGRRRGPRS